MTTLPMIRDDNKIAIPAIDTHTIVECGGRTLDYDRPKFTNTLLTKDDPRNREGESNCISCVRGRMTSHNFGSNCDQCLFCSVENVFIRKGLVADNKWEFSILDTKEISMFRHRDRNIRRADHLVIYQTCDFLKDMHTFEKVIGIPVWKYIRNLAIATNMTVWTSTQNRNGMEYASNARDMANCVLGTTIAGDWMNKYYQPGAANDTEKLSYSKVYSRKGPTSVTVMVYKSGERSFTDVVQEMKSKLSSIDRNTPIFIRVMTISSINYSRMQEAHECSFMMTEWTGSKAMYSYAEQESMLKIMSHELRSMGFVNVSYCAVWKPVLDLIFARQDEHAIPEWQIIDTKIRLGMIDNQILSSFGEDIRTDIAKGMGKDGKVEAKPIVKPKIKSTTKSKVAGTRRHNPDHLRSVIRTIEKIAADNDGYFTQSRAASMAQIPQGTLSKRISELRNMSVLSTMYSTKQRATKLINIDYGILDSYEEHAPATSTGHHEERAKVIALDESFRFASNSMAYSIDKLKGAMNAILSVVKHDGKLTYYHRGDAEAKVGRSANAMRSMASILHWIGALTEERVWINSKVYMSVLSYNADIDSIHRKMLEDQDRNGIVVSRYNHFYSNDTLRSTLNVIENSIYLKDDHMYYDHKHVATTLSIHNGSLTSRLSELKRMGAISTKRRMVKGLSAVEVYNIDYSKLED